MGGDGNDYLPDGPLRESSEDKLSGGGGNDFIEVINRPAFGDVILCGGGFDRVFADSKDVVARDCEEVAVGPAAVEELTGRLEERGFFERFFEGLAPPPPLPEG